MATLKLAGKRARAFAAEESSFGTPPTLLSSHAMRHADLTIDYNPYNRVFLPEKKAGPGLHAIADRRGTAGFSVRGLLRPSGTINTLPECSPILKNAFGSIVNTALSTTVASSGTTGGATLTSGTGGAVGASILITCPDGKKRARFLTAINTGTGVCTWAPALPSGQQPANGAAIKLGATYKLTAALASSICLARYIPEADFTAGMNEIVKGCMTDRLSLTFDHQAEPSFTAAGPAQLKDAAPSDPGSTQVGTNPPTAMTAEALFGTQAINFKQIALEMTNAVEMRNDEIGFSYPTQAYRMGDRALSFALDMAAEIDFKTAVYDAAMAGTLSTLFHQVGFTEGKIVAFYAPRVEAVPPTLEVPDGEVGWPIRGRVLESTEDGNDELLLGFL